MAASGQGVEIKRIKVGNEVILKDDVKVFEKQLEFKKLPRTFPVSTVQEILFQKDVYERVNIEVTLHNLSSVESKSTANGSLQLRTALAVDATGEINISLFNNIAQTAEMKHYKITDVTINTFNGEKILKTTERTKLKLLDKEELIPHSQENDHKVIGKAVSINIKNFTEKLQCPKCKADISEDDIDDDICVCGSCNNMCVKDSLLINDEIEFTFKDSSNRQYDLTASRSTLAEAYGESNDVYLAKAMLKKIMCIVHDDVFKVITISEAGKSAAGKD